VRVTIRFVTFAVGGARSGLPSGADTTLPRQLWKGLCFQLQAVWLL